MTLTIHDLRPHLGRLNWQLRRLGLKVQAVCDGAEVLGVEVKWSPDGWFVDCEGCGLRYKAGREAEVKCERCQRVEEGEERILPMGAPDHTFEFILSGLIPGSSQEDIENRLLGSLGVAGGVKQARIESRRAER